MGDHGHQAVVVLRGEDQHVGVELGHHSLQAGEGVEVGGAGGREHPDRSFEQVGGGALQPHLLGTGHRVTTDEPGVIGCRHNGALHPAHVGHHRVLTAPRRGQDPTHPLGHCGRRGGDEDDLGLQVVPGLVEGPDAERLGQPVVVVVESCDVPTAPTEGEGDGATDEAGPHDERPRDAPRRQLGRSSRSPWAPWR